MGSDPRPGTTTRCVRIRRFYNVYKSNQPLSPAPEETTLFSETLTH